nr:HypC/HybG/HupF family hydrogenase formation chaperone [uncultured Cohaesibacter sp.]
MCLALPAEITAINEESDMATVSLEGVKKQISLALVEDVSIGDYVLVHVGYALNKVSPQEAEKTLAIMAEAGLLASDTHVEAGS